MHMSTFVASFLIFARTVHAVCDLPYCYCTEDGGAMCKDPPKPKKTICHNELNAYIKLMACSTHPASCCHECPDLQIQTDHHFPWECENEFFTKQMMACLNLVCCEIFDPDECEKNARRFTLNQCKDACGNQ